MSDSEELLAHVAAALALHARRMRSEGRSVPPGLLVIAEWAADCVRSRHSPTVLDGLARVLDGRVMDPLLLTKHDAATLLRMSVRTVERMAANGTLTPVKVAGSVRFRRSDLDAYVAKLGGSFRDDTTTKGAA